MFWSKIFPFMKICSFPLNRNISQMMYICSWTSCWWIKTDFVQMWTKLNKSTACLTYKYHFWNYSTKLLASDSPPMHTKDSECSNTKWYNDQTWKVTNIDWYACCSMWSAYDWWTYRRILSAFVATYRIPHVIWLTQHTVSIGFSKAHNVYTIVEW